MDPFIGEIRLVAFTYAPEGWALCNGQTLSISQYSALFSLLGVQYGGNGTTTFNLPTLPGPKDDKTSAQLLYIIALNGIYPARP
jgi:microcystin-dependent protein